MIEELKIIEKFRSARNYLDVIYDKSNWWEDCNKLDKALKELEYLQQFAKDMDGADEEIKRLRQKETPMKPLNGDMCPNCKKPLFGEEDSYCPQCGKHIDWRKE